MAKNCSCAGTTCGCSVKAGANAVVTGIGTKASPYLVGLDLTAFTVGERVKVDDTATIDMTRLGSGTLADPFIIKGSVIIGDEVNNVPTSGGTTAIGPTETDHVLVPAGTLATHTITLPVTATMFMKEVTIISTAAITALTVSPAGGGVTVAGAPTALTANQFFRMRLIGTVWRRVG